jgi:hypothetical protein
MRKQVSADRAREARRDDSAALNSWRLSPVVSITICTAIIVLLPRVPSQQSGVCGRRFVGLKKRRES